VRQTTSKPLRWSCLLPRFLSVRRSLDVRHQILRHCIERAKQLDLIAALDYTRTLNRAQKIIDEARAWLINQALSKILVVFI
jgi:hypothetical protein